MRIIKYFLYRDKKSPSFIDELIKVSFFHSFIHYKLWASILFYLKALLLRCTGGFSPFKVCFYYAAPFSEDQGETFLMVLNIF